MMKMNPLPTTSQNQKKSDRQDTPFKWVFLQQRHKQRDKYHHLEECKEMGDAKSMQICREDLQDMYQNILDVKGEMDGTSLPKLVALVFQELGINQGGSVKFKLLSINSASLLWIILVKVIYFFYFKFNNS